MLVVVDPVSGVPVYRQVMEQIRFYIASGLLRPGDKLPSTRALSAELAVNPMTVSKAYALLEQEGLLDRRPGLPLVVRARSARTTEADRVEQLQRYLAPGVAAARLLGIEQEEALRVFRELLANGEEVG